MNMQPPALVNLLRVSSSEGVTVGPVLMGVFKTGTCINADRLYAVSREHGGVSGS